MPDTEIKKFSFPLDGTRITIGRDRSCNIILKGIGLSRFHAEIELNRHGPIIADLDSTFGIRINDTRIANHALLSNGDILEIGIHRFLIYLDKSVMIIEKISTCSREKSFIETGKLTGSIHIGRDIRNEISLSHSQVSRVHALVKITEDGLLIRDNHSTNGTFVNGRFITSALLNDGDVIQIGPYRLFVDEGQLVRVDDSNRISLEVSNVVIKKDTNTLLKNINLSVLPGEFVVVLGPSGAGKSTLVKALTGQTVATQGDVYANGLPLSRFNEAFASNIGYVSQQNLLYQELTPREIFRENAILRLPGDSSSLEQEASINEIVKLFDLENVMDKPVRILSGGEAKRVHLGIELLSSPAVIILDEPLAGLDPGLIRRFMRLFRKICDQGHTLILTTHSLDQLELCDRIIFLNKGCVIFNGPPCQLRSEFNTVSISEIYDRIINPEWSVNQNENDRTDYNIDFGKKKDDIFGNFYKRRSVSFFRQLKLLFSRYFRILVRDRKNLILLLVQAPLIAGLLGLVFHPGNSFLPLSFYFCITVSAIWIGGIDTIREIASEWNYLKRDKRVGLSLNAFLFSKIVLAFFLSIVQAALFGISLRFIFRNFLFDYTAFFLLIISTVCGALMGLCISSFCKYTARAVSMLPVLFIPQIFFSGILIPFDRMTMTGQILSHLTLSRPVFGMFKQLSLFQRKIWDFSQWPALFFLNTGIIILTLVAIRRKIVKN